MQSARPSADIPEIGRKLDALAIIFAAPPAPQRERLSEPGRALLDAIEADGKACALAIVDMRFADAFAILALWSRIMSAFIDATLIHDPDPVIAESNSRMCRLFRYWCDAAGADFSAVKQ